MKDEITTIFEPAKGVVKAKTEQLVIVSFTFFKGGKVEELFTCHVDDMETPLGFLMTSID